MIDVLELQAEVYIAEKEVEDSRIKILQIKRELVETETLLISNKIKLEKLQEQLRMFQETFSEPELTIEELEIKKFQQEHVELCQWARQRDLSRILT